MAYGSSSSSLLLKVCLVFIFSSAGSYGQQQQQKEDELTVTSNVIVAITSTPGPRIENPNQKLINDEPEARRFIEDLNEKLERLNYALVNASWNFNTDISPENEAILLDVTAQFNQEQKRLWQQVRQYQYEQFQDEQLRRQFEKLSVLGIAALDEKDSKRYTNISTTMEKIYSSATICLDGKCGLELDPDLGEIMSKSRDYEKLKQVWLQWRQESGRQIRDLYKEYIVLGNQAAKLNGFETLDDLWLFPWETSNFKQQVAQLWDQIRPYYLKLHAYVRMRLRDYYGAERMPTDGTIPAHLLGNMWAQDWANIFDLVAPYPERKTLDVTETMRAQNYTPLEMFRLSEKFFTDLGLIPMPDTFWKHSMLTKPTDGRKVVCHASAWDFFNRRDFRIKMCTNINMEDLITVHHEMGHVQYYLQYKDQPVPFREGANPGFHEAVGDLLALSVSTPTHLRKIDLLPPDRETDRPEDQEQLTLNYQMRMALTKMAFLPFGYLMDAYRWDLFSGKTPATKMNERWWWYRLNYQGLSPPARRNETDFDAGAKYHIPASVEYIRYFVSFIVQFQFHKSVCEIAQPGVPLYQCDIDGNRAAGQRLAEMLQLGSSRPWPAAMKLMTGSEEMSAEPLIEYFSPLWKYLDQRIANETLGWKAKVSDYVE